MDRIDPKRVLWAGPLTLLAAVGVVTCIRLGSVSILMPDPDFQPLMPFPPVLDTVVFGGAAIFVFFRMCFSSFDDPTPRYRSLAWKLLVLSFIPDIALAVQHWYGGNWAEALSLMTMHLAVWVLCVAMLPALARGRRYRKPILSTEVSN